MEVESAHSGFVFVRHDKCIIVMAPFDKYLTNNIYDMVLIMIIINMTTTMVKRASISS